MSFLPVPPSSPVVMVACPFPFHKSRAAWDPSRLAQAQGAEAVPSAFAPPSPYSRGALSPEAFHTILSGAGVPIPSPCSAYLFFTWKRYNRCLCAYRLSSECKFPGEEEACCFALCCILRALENAWRDAQWALD